jgi:transcriptional regulator with XRE-family HTH domain
MSFGQHGPGQGLSQRTVAEAAQISRAAYGRIERAEAASLPISVAFRVSAVLGLDLSVRLYPGPEPIRDAGQASRLGRLVASVGLPLRYRTDVPLPSPPLGPPEQRAWDLEIRGHGERTTIELETRITDVQEATLRRHGAKRRDDPADHFLLVLADSRHNRALLRDRGPLLADLPRLRTATVPGALRAGRHPPTGLILF